MASGYHGNTSNLVDLSDYKHAGPGGQGPPDWVHVVPMPDPYRGLYRGESPELGARYAELCKKLEPAQARASVPHAPRPCAPCLV